MGMLVYPAEHFARRGYAVAVYNKGLGPYPRNEKDYLARSFSG
jgi:hypothetical protein